MVTDFLSVIATLLAETRKMQKVASMTRGRTNKSRLPTFTAERFFGGTMKSWEIRPMAGL